MRVIAWLVPVLLFACDDADPAVVDAGPPAPDAAAPDTSAEPEPYAPCDPAARVGGFSVSLEEGYTAVGGFVRDAVLPSDVWTVLATEGDCHLRVGPVLHCEPGCGAGETCAGAGGCVPYPRNQSVGTVRIEGLAAPVEMEPSAVGSYNFVGDLPHPGVAQGATVHLLAAGGDQPAFELTAQGVAPLEAPGDPVPASADRPVALRWTRPAAPGPARVQVRLDIAHHGGTLAEIECDVADTGALDIPASLVAGLFERGVAGFPAVTLTRRTVDSTATAAGCVELVVASAVTLDVAIDGLRSCSFDEDCPDGESCAPELVCR